MINLDWEFGQFSLLFNAVVKICLRIGTNTPKYQNLGTRSFPLEVKLMFVVSWTLNFGNRDYGRKLLWLRSDDPHLTMTTNKWLPENKVHEQQPQERAEEALQHYYSNLQLHFSSSSQVFIYWEGTGVIVSVYNTLLRCGFIKKTLQKIIPNHFSL